jgi:putative ATP-dependent endonuclease of OLD family
MARVKQLRIENFKSIQNQLILNFSDNAPIVLIGENNAGKSNIIRALDLMFGEFHPKYKDLEDHEYYGRNPLNEIVIEVDVSGFNTRLGRSNEFSCMGFKFNAKKGIENGFDAKQSDGNYNRFVSNVLRGELTSVVVNSEQNLSYQLSYISKYTLLSKVTKSFHNKLSSDQNKVDRLKTFYENITAIFLEVTEFRNFKESMSSIAGEVISNMTYGLELDFTAYDPSNYFKQLKINPSEQGVVRSFEELGTGQQQILALSFAHAYSKSFLNGDLILIIDEPESHLHPLAQKWLARTMFKMATDGLQLIITTHSPHFINLEYFSGINLIRKDADGTYLINNSKEDLFNYCIETKSDPIRTSIETVVPFYNNHSTAHILNALFAKKIILVEGPTEELALPILLEKVGFDTLKEGVEVINVSGKGNLAKWWRFFTLYKIPTFVCFDNDARPIHGKDALKAIGIPEENLDGIIGLDNWNISDKFCVFGKDYEATMRISFSEYSTMEEQNKTTLGSSSKHIVARKTARMLTINDDIGWIYLNQFVEKINNLN